MVLILRCPFDVHSDLVAAEFARVGQPYRRLETERFPRELHLSLEFNEASAEAHVLEAVNGFDLAPVRSVWYRRPDSPQVLDSLSSNDRAFALAESTHFMTGLFHILRDRFWVNPFDEDRRAHHKPYQLMVARSLGLEIPKTLITNEPAQALQFVRALGGTAVYKPMTAPVRAQGGKGFGLFTTQVSLDDVRGRADQISIAPCIFQEMIPKAAEYRITVVGRRAFVVEIDSQINPEWLVDWRRCRNELSQVPHRTSSLPETIESRLLALVQKLGLVLGCIDMIRTPDGRYIFLEINPSGQWYWLEERTGQPLLSAFCELLTTCNGRGTGL